MLGNHLECPRHSPLDPRTLETEQVQKIINLQHIVNNLSEAFTDYKGVTKSSYPARNAPEKSGGTNKNHSTLTSKEEGEKYGRS